MYTVYKHAAVQLTANHFISSGDSQFVWVAGRKVVESPSNQGLPLIT